VDIQRRITMKTPSLNTSTIPGPPAAPTKDMAATNLLQQGKKRAPVGFSSTLFGDNQPSSAVGQKTLLGS
jgi:hypothetical protein